MRRDPFPAFHRTANEKAASTVRDGHELRDRADALLGSIDELLGADTSAGVPTSPAERTAA